MLAELDEELNAPRDFAGVRRGEDAAPTKIDRYRLTHVIDRRIFFPTMEAAVEAYRR